MTRLQKKCLIAAAGTHFLLVVVLLCSGFIKSKPKQDDSQILTMIPATAIDQALESGVRNAQPPPPTPVVQPQPEPPKPIQPVEPPKPVEQVAPPKPEEPQVTKPEEPAETKPKPQPRKIEISLKPVVRKPNESSNADEEVKAAKEAKKLRDARAKAIKSALNNIEKNASQSTTVEMRGDSTVAYANYASIVKTVYTEAWNLPETAASDDANVKVSVTIARDGRVIEAHIVEKSGDDSVDRSVQNTLDRVTQIRPFPDDSTDKERTYIINFNLKAKRMLG